MLRIIQINSSVAVTVLLLTATFFHEISQAQIVRDSVPELINIDIVEHLGDTLPLNLSFIDDHGDSVKLGDYFGHGKPILLTLGYFQCPMLCNLVFNGVSDGIKEVGWTPGEKFEVVSVSINPKETKDLAQLKKANYIKSLGIPSAENGWHFLVGEKSQSEALAQAIGFKYYFVPDRGEYAHPAAAYIISPNGVITRYLYGIHYSGSNLKLGLLEASEGKIGSTVDRIILYCFHYDPDAKGYVLFAQNVMKLGGLATVVALSIFLGTLWIKDQLRPEDKSPDADTQQVAKTES